MSSTRVKGSRPPSSPGACRPYTGRSGPIWLAELRRPRTAPPTPGTQNSGGRPSPPWRSTRNDEDGFQPWFPRSAASCPTVGASRRVTSGRRDSQKRPRSRRTNAPPRRSSPRSKKLSRTPSGFDWSYVFPDAQELPLETLPAGRAPGGVPRKSAARRKSAGSGPLRPEVAEGRSIGSPGSLRRVPGDPEGPPASDRRRVRVRMSERYFRFPQALRRVDDVEEEREGARHRCRCRERARTSAPTARARVRQRCDG